MILHIIAEKRHIQLVQVVNIMFLTLLSGFKGLMVVAILSLPPLDEELCINIKENIQILKLKF